ncbi:MAG: sulfatase-like hydrolase/transferase, partial [Alphaproteobacteria bacterium]|nr:sulfatase-like hydrolase/transferase [Alphaproteobacteria bacterium]
MMRILLTLFFSCLSLRPSLGGPNIVLIMADDVGCEPIGAYGGQRWRTPNIDALAQGGM